MSGSASYDFIICGAGCAGLSLVTRMVASGKFDDKRILLIDRETKNKNDRTWCFWEKDPGFFEDVVYRKWDTISFLSDEFSSAMSIAPYQYKMIRGIDFYQYCLERNSSKSNVEMVYGEVKDLLPGKGEILVSAAGREFTVNAPIIFNSIYRPAAPVAGSIRLLQHFKGWVIQTPHSNFDPRIATMMDFRVSQRHGTSFAYVLPLSSSSALVEYTLFTKSLLEQEQYDQELREYIGNMMGIVNYSIQEVEFGIIPMTNERFNFEGQGWQIGVAGGQTKASSGYTFQFIQKQSELIVSYLVQGKSLASIPKAPGRFRFYDNTLLDVLYHETIPGRKIFTTLFRKNKPQAVLQFLDNESKILDELKIIRSLPTLPFLKAALKQW